VRGRAKKLEELPVAAPNSQKVHVDLVNKTRNKAKPSQSVSVILRRKRERERV
jgi:hypothetical protein